MKIKIKKMKIKIIKKMKIKRGRNMDKLEKDIKEKMVDIDTNTSKTHEYYLEWDEFTYVYSKC